MAINFVTAIVARRSAYPICQPLLFAIRKTVRYDGQLNLTQSKVYRRLTHPT
ncbi:MAG: hypothetical protein KME17_20235 [Cyanosarcina radialis HA8281-LM2]|nr:hypothetical protein [Cyanosarcina radialis HA8281-LM2]